MLNNSIEADRALAPAPAFPIVQFQFNKPTVQVGVIADTHVPDRIKVLPPRIFKLFEGVDLILHAGDLSRPDILDELRGLAPTIAVQGNRDIFYRANQRLPMNLIVEVDSVKIGLTHGHGGLRGYIREKLIFLTTGAYRYSQYEQKVQQWFAHTNVQAIVFGHTHFPICKFSDGTLIFNPGSIGPDYKRREGASVGWLQIDTAAKTVQGQIKFLAAP